MTTIQVVHDKNSWGKCESALCTIIPQNSECSISRVPREILLHIFTFIPELNAVAWIESTCKCFKILSSEEVLWKQRFTLRFPDIPIRNGKSIKQQVQMQLRLQEIQDKTPSDHRGYEGLTCRIGYSV